MYGIDLGTTNSAIAQLDGDTLRVLKNKEQMDTTPSAVLVSRNGRMLVGKRAYEARLAQAGSVATSFKRVMGQSDVFRFDGVAKAWSPEELSAEILKSLLDDARRATGSDVRRAVVTVPADFSQLQCEATSRAAQLAGLGDIVLLQEPIAAAVAYGTRDDVQGKRWIVYDFGGGTFDAALVSTEGGRLAVIDHAGDNMCGGKDIDRDIVQQLLWPALAADYNLPRLDSPDAQRLKSALYKAAEEAKIELSSVDSTIAAVLDAGADLDGDPIEAEIEITRAALEGIVLPYVERTVKKCEELLARAGVGAGEVAGVLLVGGPTYIPILRARVGEGLGLPVVHTLDPMTVVAQGAALYAAQAFHDAAEPAPAVVDEGAIAIALVYPPTCGEASASVLMRITDARVTHVQLEAASGVWVSGWVGVGGRRTADGGGGDALPLSSPAGGTQCTDAAAQVVEVAVPLVTGKANEFVIGLRDGDGKAIACTPKMFTIRQGLTVDAPPLPHSLGAEIVLPDKTLAIDVLFPRGTPLPASRSVTYRAARTLAKDAAGDSLAFKVWEGEHAQPDCNTWVGALNIHAGEIVRAIPHGAEVQIDVALDESRRMAVHVYVPVIDQHFEGNVFVPVENQESAVTQARELETVGASLHTRLTALREKSRRAGDRALAEELRLLEAQLDDLLAAGDAAALDPDEAKRLVHRVRQLRAAVAEHENAVQAKHGVTLAVSEANEALHAAERVLGQAGEKSARLEDLRRQLAQAAQAGDRRQLEAVKDDLWDVWWNAVQYQGWYWADRFDALAGRGVRFTNPKRAQELITEGEALVGTDDGMALRPFVQALWRLRPANTQVEERVGDSGLRR